LRRRFLEHVVTHWHVQDADKHTELALCLLEVPWGPPPNPLRAGAPLAVGRLTFAGRPLRSRVGGFDNIKRDSVEGG
jgi:hypothetical protein